MRSDNPQSYAGYFRAGRTYGHYGRASASAKPDAERQHDINNHDDRSHDC
jgi:hypothetical protein